MDIQKIIKTVANMFFVGIILLVIFSVTFENDGEEAYIGDFGTRSLNKGWTFSFEENIQNIELPYTVNNASKKNASMTRKLPDDLSDGMRLCVRSNMEDVTIYINGEQRQIYESNDDYWAGYYTPSAYILVDIGEADAGKPITIEYVMKKSTSTIEEISFGYGNNAWFEIIHNNVVEAAIAVIMIILGVLSIALYIVFRLRYSINKSSLYLGQSIMMIGIWVLSESRLRQLLLSAPSITGIYCYLAIELMGVFLILYFDEIQGKRYHKIYTITAGVILLQFIINTTLSVFEIRELHETLIYSHVWIFIGIITTFILLIIDLIKGQMKNYNVAATGIFLLLLAGIGEIVGFYFTSSHSFGICLSIGLIVMLAASMFQMLIDIYRKERRSKEHIQRTTMATIETIASSIDAKDEYTGGHSERVAHYSKILAKNLPEEYNMTTEDIMRIHYIGLMHDIGKIGVPDAILNKAGKLTDDEYQLMKRHAIIGSDMLREIDTIEGLAQGVRHHHERYDGKGYPDGLKGEDIPLIARILCLADCYDAMTSNRVYRRRLSDEQVRDEIERCKGTQFDPKLAQIFCELLDDGKMVPMTHKGYELKADGTVLKSSVLRYLLAIDRSEGKNEITNPSFIRMVSYIVKMAEKQGKEVKIYIVTCGDNAEKVIEKNMDSNDLSIEYTKGKRLVAWFEEDDKVAVERISKIKEELKGEEILFEDISEYWY